MSLTRVLIFTLWVASCTSCLTGHWPFVVRGRDEFRDKHLQAPVPKLPNDASFFTAMNQILHRCMAKRKVERFGTADELLRDLCLIYEQQFSEAPKPVEISGEFTKVDYNNRGKSYAHLRRYEDALSDYANAIRLDPTFAGAYSNRGLVYEKLKRYTEALADFTQSITTDPINRDAYRNVGALLAKRGLLKEALPYFQKAGDLGDLQSQDLAKQIRERGGE